MDWKRGRAEVARTVRLGGMLAALLGLVACASVEAPGGTGGSAVSYTLGSESVVRSLYPDASWLPQPYAADYQDLASTIALFTQQSLQRDGVADPQVQVSFVGSGDARSVQLNIQPVNEVTQRYAQIHPRFLDAAHGQQALKGTAACKASSGCWDPQPRSGQPWAAYLPLGLPMVTQESVLFLDYPPIPALTGKDYLNNFTMCRWGRVMGAAGASSVYAYETIVDSRPIAAPGSGEDAYLPDPQTWFNDVSGVKGYYITPMLSLLAHAEAGSKAALPVAVFGSPARSTWGKIVGSKSVGVLDTGSTTLQSGGPTVPWIATNHPDVTTYQCCPNDPDKSCGSSYSLLKDEQTDFVAACWLLTMAAEPALSTDQAMQQCKTRWGGTPNAADQQSLCVQAKLDNNNPAAVCASYTEAWNYCSAHSANACATFDCKYDPAKVTTPVPSPSDRPAGWAQTCNSFR